MARPPADTTRTLREKEIVRGIEDDLSYKLIADRLSVSLETVRTHIRQIHRKLHVNSKAEIISRSWVRPRETA